ncbi:coiled-coil domain-containing protein 55-domain containing protein [Halteromyces radiatus]|uniref:coiled-coil domain-containing protein 55-domain containing protein n=1 Tax=Halteromyces radiatus TaxID=101107 RepID=UPI00221EBE88|nr:coiled-coil domain-containing protein 55-domain containing protein [Halteromyces radiatus]KAI8099758.1 coiled-coil domain-containing protein 55-domain containing protein [Halteromyces radiatus]
MKFGLNLSKKKTTFTRSVSTPAAAFNLHDDDDDEDKDTQQLSAKEQAKRQRQKINQQLTTSAGTTLANQKVKEAQEQALLEDPTIFDYDAVYDDLKQAEQEQKARQAKKDGHGDDNKKAKYIQNLLNMAEIRKRDRLLAEEKKVARERQAEGDQYADKEVFLTESYKKQKAELERIEAEERLREEEAAKKSTLTSFYKQVLDKKDAEHRAMVEATLSKKQGQDKTSSSSSSSRQEDREALAQIEEAKRKGIKINDNNEVVDKRDLLGAGLNVASKPKFGSFGSLASSDTRIKERMEEYEAYKRNKVAEYEARRKGDDRSRERLSREIERQMVETKRKADQEMEDKQVALQQAAAVRRTTEDAVMSARDRYLARKKQKTAQGSTSSTIAK